MLIFIRDCSFRSPLVLLCFSYSKPDSSLFISESPQECLHVYAKHSQSSFVTVASMALTNSVRYCSELRLFSPWCCLGILRLGGPLMFFWFLPPPGSIYHSSSQPWPLLISLSSPEQEGRCSPLVILYLNAPARWPECESLTEEDSLLELTVMRPPLSPPPSFLTLLGAATLKYLLHHWQALTLPQCQRFSTQEGPGTLRRTFSCCCIQTLLNNCLDPS